MHVVKKKRDMKKRKEIQNGNIDLTRMRGIWRDNETRNNGKKNVERQRLSLERREIERGYGHGHGHGHGVVERKACIEN